MTGQPEIPEYADVVRIARLVAPLLPNENGGKWRVCEGNDCPDLAQYRYAVTLINLDGRTLHFGRARDLPGKLHIAGQLPGRLYGHKRYDEHLSSINVSATKTPDVIARDIARRVLPEYSPMYARAAAALADSDARYALQDRIVERMAKVFGANLRERRDWQNHAGSSSRELPRYDADMYLSGLVSGRCKVSGDTVTLELAVSPEMAETIAELLRAARVTTPA